MPIPVGDINSGFLVIAIHFSLIITTLVLLYWSHRRKQK